MALKATEINDLQVYLDGVLERASHHASGVNEVVLTLAGAVVWKKDPGSDLTVREYNGRPANILWVKIGREQYAFRYDHPTEKIEMREGSHNGEVRHVFDNETTASQIFQIFDGL